MRWQGFEHVAQSSEARLSALEVHDPSGNAVPLNPDFSGDITTYDASVINSVDSITVTPTVLDSTATVTVNGQTVASGEASEAIALIVGDNVFTVEVTAEDGTTKAYTLTINREAELASSEARLSALEVRDPAGS